ncbi:MAG: hypothetical protein AAFX79_13835 [Planctomycetota bacterium]
MHEVDPKHLDVAVLHLTIDNPKPGHWTAAFLVKDEVSGVAVAREVPFEVKPN